MVLAPIRFDDFKLPESERCQTMSATEGYVVTSDNDIFRDMEMAWKQLRRESVITQVRQSNYLLVILNSKTSLTNVSAYSESFVLFRQRDITIASFGESTRRC